MKGHEKGRKKEGKVFRDTPIITILCESEDENTRTDVCLSTDLLSVASAENKFFEEGQDGLGGVEVRRVAAAFQLAHAHAVGQVALERVPG